MRDLKARDWQTSATAPKDGSRILALIGASEQGGHEVDVVHWGNCRGYSEPCWIADGSYPACEIIYNDCEISGWSPMPDAKAYMTSPTIVVAAVSQYGLDGAGI